MFAVSCKDSQDQVFPVHKIRSILLQKSVKLSTDAMAMALENEIELILIDKRGMPLGRLWSHRYGSIATIRRHQIDFSSSKEGYKWVKSLVVKKIGNQLAVLTQFSYSVKGVSFISSINKLYNYIDKIETADENETGFYDTLRGWEGVCARIYFAAINVTLEQKWQFEKRSQHYAQDPFNACINYLYGMLYIKVELALIVAGLDPYLGFFHKDEYRRPTLVFDVIEQYRIFVDELVIALFHNEKLVEDDFELLEQGIFVSSKGKRIIVPAFNEYMLEIIPTEHHRNASRAELLQLDAYALANKLKIFKKLT